MNAQNMTTLKTLRDVRLVLPAVYSESSVRTLTYVLDKIENITGQKLVQFPADENAWVKHAQDIVWTGHFRGATPGAQKEAFDGWVSKIAAMIKRAQNHVRAPVQCNDQSGAWDLIVDYAEDVQGTFDPDGELILASMSAVSTATLRSNAGDIHPADMTTDAAITVLQQCRPDKIASLRNAFNVFNRLIREQNRHAAIAHLLPNEPLGPLPLIRDVALDWSRFSAEFISSRDRAIKRAINPDRQQRRDRFDGRLGKSKLTGLGKSDARGRGRNRKVRNVEAARKAHLNALSWLIRHAFPDRELAYALNDIEEVFETDIILQAVQAYIDRAAASEVLINPQDTASAGNILSRLETLAERNGFSDDAVFELQDARFDRLDSYRAREMSKSREQFVRLVDRDPAIARAIVSGPRRLAAEAALVLDDWDKYSIRSRDEAMHLSMGSSMLALLLARSVRSRNLNGLLIAGEDAELIRPLRESRPWLQFARSRIKNRRPIEGEIPERQWIVIAAWLEKGLPRWCEKHGVDIDTNEYFLPGPAGVLSRSTYNKVWNKCVERLGVPGLQPHMMRHVTATIWLAANPGDYATVAAFLGDSASTVEKFYARGEGAAAAKLFAEAIEDIDPTLNAFLKRN